MRILLLADEESKYYWDFFDKKKLDGIDLIISCGDLAPQYLEFLATYAKVPILYVKGNHDYCYDETPPGGCICIDGKVYEHNGFKIAGLGGCMEYNGSSTQFSEKAMSRRLKLLSAKIKLKGGVDIFITHAPAYHINDSDDLPHTGFKCFVSFLEKYKPKVFAHGHVHINYGRDFKREDVYGETRIINAYEKYVIDVE